jgi:uncharacterized membrane protein
MMGLQEGWNKFYMRAAETVWLPAGLLAGSVYWLYHALSAGTDSWLYYLQLFDESRLVHATSVDFALCTLLMPFWLSNDASQRKWESRWVLHKATVAAAALTCQKSRAEMLREMLSWVDSHQPHSVDMLINSC